jgi:hypothetical protein
VPLAPLVVSVHVPLIVFPVIVPVTVTSSGAWAMVI